MKKIFKYPKLTLIIFLATASALIWYQTTTLSKNCGDNPCPLKIAFLNIGQGDSIFIETPHGNQILIDGGPSGKVLQELGKQMSFFDNSIDMIVVTNPDRDHIAGFLDVLKRFDVSTEVEPGTISSTAVYKELTKKVAQEGAKKIIARRGMNFLLDTDVHLLILFPDKDVSTFSTNNGSIVAKLVYKNTSVLLTGDAPEKTEKYLNALEILDHAFFATSSATSATSTPANSAHLKSDILKIGHHGSKSATSQEFLDKVLPSYAVISSGKNNSYGHPSPEVTDRLTKNKIPILGTYAEGTIVFESDGERWVRK